MYGNRLLGGCCRVNEACSAYLLSCQGEHLLLDCGSGAASMLQNALPLQELHHVLLSHYHYDHCSDAGALSYGRLIQMQTGAAQQPLHFYGLPVEPYFERLTMEPYTYAQTIGADDKLQIGPFCCTFHKTAHPVECLAVKGKCGQSTLVYTADGAYTPQLAEFAEGADLLIAECSLYAGADGARAGHMTSTDVAQLGRKAAPGMLLLSHLPLYGDPHLLVDQVKARTSYWTACARSSARSVLAHWKTVLVHRRTLCIFSGLGWQGTPSLM